MFETFAGDARFKSARSAKRQVQEENLSHCTKTLVPKTCNVRVYARWFLNTGSEKLLYCLPTLYLLGVKVRKIFPASCELWQPSVLRKTSKKNGRRKASV